MKGHEANRSKSVDEYIAAQPEAVRPKLQSRASGIAWPDTSCRENRCCISLGFKEHYSLFAASGTFFAALEDEPRGYDLRKGTVHFPLNEPVPVGLIGRIAKLRAAGIAAAMKKPPLGRGKERRTSEQ
jgi:uncharacterized protein YdhG (YjbR/CyaY superfamily)